MDRGGSKASRAGGPAVRGVAKEEEVGAAPRTCPFCKQEIADDATRCPHCTSKLEGYVNEQE